MQPAAHITDPLAPFIFGVTLILVCALLGRLAANRFGQPTVIGELIVGIALGNALHWAGYDLIVILREGAACLDIGQLAFAGHSWDEAATQVLGDSAGHAFLAVLSSADGGQYLQIAQAMDMFVRYGVIFLLFRLGLGASVAKLRQVNADAMRVAGVGIVAPFALGLTGLWWFAPGASHTQALFLAATLVATSIAITAQMLDKQGRSRSPEARTILNAAVLDDVVAVILLTVVTSIALGGHVTVHGIVGMGLLAIIVFVIGFLGGPHIQAFLNWLTRHLDVLEARLFISLIFVLVLAGVAIVAGLLSFVGAFVAGLLMIDSESKAGGEGDSLKDLLAPLEAILLPIFFLLLGIQVKLEMFLEWQSVALLLVLLTVAFAGKLVSGLGAGHRANRLTIGVGMIPRGEMGLAFAAIGKIAGIIDAGMFSALVILVIVTTLAAPPLLKASLRQP